MDRTSRALSSTSFTLRVALIVGDLLTSLLLVKVFSNHPWLSPHRFFAELDGCSRMLASSASHPSSRSLRERNPELLFTLPEYEHRRGYSIEDYKGVGTSTSA